MVRLPGQNDIQVTLKNLRYVRAFHQQVSQTPLLFLPSDLQIAHFSPLQAAQSEPVHQPQARGTCLPEDPAQDEWTCQLARPFYPHFHTVFFPLVASYTAYRSDTVRIMPKE